MKIEVLAHGNTNPEKIILLYKTARFYAKYLNLSKSKYTIMVCSAPNLRKHDGNNGVASKTGIKEITVVVDSQLKLPQMLMTLAHEMVHAKQYIRGHYKATVSRNGKLKKLWLGKQYSVVYHKRPWEREAFRREGELVNALLENVTQSMSRT
jgi:hypothetical protein